MTSHEAVRVADPVDKSPARIARMFDAIAGRYDLLNHLLSGGLDLYWRRRAIRALALRGTEVLLDVCTGTADVTLAALRRGPSGPQRVIGLDFAQAMLQVGQQKIQRRGVQDRVHLVRADAMHVPVRTGQAQAATIAFGIRNVCEPAVALAEIRRVLAPGGRVAILEFAMPRTPWLRAAYAWYFRQVLPRIGRLLSRHNDAYTYLPASVGTFYEPEAFQRMLVDAGFRTVTASQLSCGIVYLYVGWV